MRDRCRRVLAAALLLCAAALEVSAAESGYPARPLRLIVPFAPGGGADISARVVGQGLSERLGQQVVVDNRPGAGGNLGTELAARAAPDGYTIALVSSSYGANPSLYKLPFDPVTGFAPITLVSQQPFVVVVNNGVPVRTLREFVAYTKANPGKLNYVSSGLGGIQHLATELFKQMAGVDIVHVPYKGGASGLADLLSGQVHVEFATVLGSMPIVKAGQLRALAVTTAERATALPELPTIAESGVPGYAVSGWYAVLAPAGTPDTIVARLNREIIAVLACPDVRERYAREGSQIVAGSPGQLQAHLRTEVSKWQKLVQSSNIRLDAAR